MLASIREEQWMIRPDLIHSYALEALNVPERSEDFYDEFYNLRRPMEVGSDRIATIHVVGALMAKAPPIYEKLGLVTRYSTIISEIGTAVSSGARGILFNVSSPGGTVSGNIEAAEAIASASVPTAAHCVGMACSAAYKLSAGTGGIIASPSAEVGNVGTVLSWVDCEEFWKRNGIEFKALVNDGADLKSTFHTEPNETQLAFLQESINEAGAEFQRHVREGRARAGVKIDEEVWRAGWYSGRRAGDLGLIDGIGSEDDARQWLASRV
jgi:protease-4